MHVYVYIYYDLVKKLLEAAKKFFIEFMEFCDNNNMFSLNHKKKTFEAIQFCLILNLPKKGDVSKNAEIDNFACKFLRDGANVLPMTMTQICNISIKISYFLEYCKVTKL